MSLSPNVAAPPPQSQSSLSFSQGFLLGQLSIVLLLGAFIKVFIFGDPPSAETTASSRAQRSLRNRPQAPTSDNTSPTPKPRPRSISLTTSTSSSPTHLRRKRSSVLRHPATPPLTTATILSKTYYNVHSHQPESLDWFNVLIAQTIAQVRSDARLDDAVLTSLSTVLNGPARPDWLDEIRVTDLSLGEEFPIFSNCRVGPIVAEEDGGGHGGTGGAGGGGSGGGEGGGGAGDSGRLQARMDVDLSDDLITLALETKILLNYPKPRTAVLPVALSVSVVRFSGTLSISFLPSSSSSSSSSSQAPSSSHQNSPGIAPTPSPTTLSFTFLPDYRLDLSIRSLVGSRSRLQDVPKIAQIVESRLREWFDERCVEPRVQQVVLPSLWPRKRNVGTRAGAGDEEDGLDVGLDEGRWEREREREREGLRLRREVVL